MIVIDHYWITGGIGGFRNHKGLYEYGNRGGDRDCSWWKERVSWWKFASENIRLNWTGLDRTGGGNYLT